MGHQLNFFNCNEMDAQIKSAIQKYQIPITDNFPERETEIQLNNGPIQLKFWRIWIGGPPTFEYNKLARAIKHKSVFCKKHQYWHKISATEEYTKYVNEIEKQENDNIAKNKEYAVKFLGARLIGP